MHFTVQTDQPTSTVFQICWASCNIGVNVILQKYGKGGGKGGGTSLRQLEFYFNTRLFSVVGVFFSSFLLSLSVHFLFLFHNFFFLRE